jgi:hypothetical protein
MGPDLPASSAAREPSLKQEEVNKANKRQSDFAREQIQPNNLWDEGIDTSQTHSTLNLAFYSFNMES